MRTFVRIRHGKAWKAVQPNEDELIYFYLDRSGRVIGISILGEL